MMRKGMYILVTGCLLWWGCRQEDHEATSEGMCACLVELDRMNRQLDSLMQAGDPEPAMALLDEFEGVAHQTRDCLTDNGWPLEAGDAGSEELAEHLDARCPGWRELLASLPPASGQ